VHSADPCIHIQNLITKTLHNMRAGTGDAMHVLQSIHAYYAAGERVTIAQVSVYHVKCCNGWKCQICHKRLSGCILHGIPQI